MNELMMKYFVLKPSGTDSYALASRAAIRTYATVIEPENPELANDLHEWLLRLNIQLISIGDNRIGDNKRLMRQFQRKKNQKHK